LDFSAQTTATPNNPPYVLAFSPIEDTVGSPGGTVPLKAWAFDDGAIVMVQFQSTTNLAVLGQGNSVAKVWTNQWVHPPLGEHWVYVRALDDSGAVGETWPRRVLISNIRGRVEAVGAAPDGRLELTLSGSAAGAWEIEHSTNLTDWSAAGRTTNGPGFWTWQDARSLSEAPRRFYRMRLLGESP
jgi:hypothetical protein